MGAPRQLQPLLMPSILTEVIPAGSSSFRSEAVHFRRRVHDRRFRRPTSTSSSVQDRRLRGDAHGSNGVIQVMRIGLRTHISGTARSRAFMQFMHIHAASSIDVNARSAGQASTIYLQGIGTAWQCIQCSINLNCNACPERVTVCKKKTT